MTRSQHLHDLQVLDRRRDDAMQRLREVIMELRGGGGIAKAQSTLEKREAVLAELERKLRAVEAARGDLKASVARDEQHLYQGTAMHPKEIEGQRRALASHRKQLAQRDDEALELLLERDEANEKVDAAREALSQAKSRLEESQAELKAERIQLARTIKGAEPVIEEARTRIAPADLARYDRLRKAPGLHGLAVAALEGDVCQGCGQQLPRHESIVARGQDALAVCPGCGRLVHA